MDKNSVCKIFVLTINKKVKHFLRLFFVYYDRMQHKSLHNTLFCYIYWYGILFHR